MAKTVDMTTGSAFKKIFFFSIPIALGYLLQNLYSLGDSIIVSLARGAAATTGINLTGSISFLIIGFAQGISVGFGIVLAQYVGARNEEKMRNTVAVSILLTILVGALFSVLGVSLARWILTLLKTDELYIDYSTEYIQAIMSGMIFMSLYNLSDQIMRAMGDSKTPLLILILCAVLNVGLNALLFVTNLPVAWAGWATVISQGVSAIVGYIVIFSRFKNLRLKKEDFKTNAKFVGKLFSVGLPMAFQFSITAIGCMIQQRAFNLLGDKFAMAQGTASKIDNIFGCFMNGVGTAMATYCGQNYGAKKLDRIKNGFNSALLVGVIFTVLSMTGAILTCRPLSALLLPNVESGIYDMAFGYIITQSCCYYFLFLIFMPRQAVQAIGLSGGAMMGGVIELILRIIAANTFIVWAGVEGAYFSNPLAWFGGAVFFVVAFIYRVKKLEKEWGVEKEAKNEESSVA